MAELTKDDVGVKVPGQDRKVAAGRKTISLPDITFGDGSKTYPTGGVPLPGIGHFGLKKEIQRLFIQQPSKNGFVYKYDPENHKIKVFTQGVTTGSTSAAATEDGALVEKSDGSEGDVRLSNTSADSTYDLGEMIELPSGVALSETTLAAMVVGE